jgi:Pilus formation protein N terminal region
MSKMKIGYGLSIAALTFTFLTGKVVAAELLVVQVDKTQIISLSEEPGIVVVGNPSMADVSVNGKHVFVHGHSFGDTNLIIIDKNGNQLANFDLTVQHNSSNALAMYKAGNRTSYTCANLIQPLLRKHNNNSARCQAHACYVALLFDRLPTIGQTGLVVGTKLIEHHTISRRHSRRIFARIVECAG